MTITAQDRKSAEDKMGPFSAQDELTADLPNVLQNMLREFSQRDAVPSDMTLTERRARKICHHDDRIGSYTLDIENRLTSEFNDYHYEGAYRDDLSISQLKEITENPDCSCPIVKLSMTILEDNIGYSIQTDSRGNGRDIYVLVLQVNHEKVLIYDPYRFRGSQGQKMEPTEVEKRGFTRAWLGQWEVTNTLWIQRTDQKRMSEFYNE